MVVLLITRCSEVEPLNIERHEITLADLTPDEIRSLIEGANARSNDLGCIIFRPPGVHDCTAVIFAGNLERFFMIAVARYLSCPVMIVQDPISYWYQGSEVLPDLTTLIRTVIVPEVGSSRALLFGQSSGGYAALAASAAFTGATVVACAPQTRSDGAIKGRLKFVGIRALATPDGLLDVRALLMGQPDTTTMRASIIAAGELDNPATAHWWGDYLHILPMMDVPNMHLYIVHANTHVLAHGRVNEFARLLEALSKEITADPVRREEIVATFLSEQFAKA